MTLNVVILAAGQGSRMRSDLPKVLHSVGGCPMVAHVIAAANALEPSKIVIVYGHGGDLVKQAIHGDNLIWAEQAEQKGTGHAVMQALPHLDSASTTLILYGDVPLIKSSTLAELAASAGDRPALLTALLSDPTGYGRVVRSVSGEFERVVEQKDACPQELTINEVNTGVLAVPTDLLMRYLPQVGNSNAQGEYYLPDILPMALQEGLSVNTVAVSDALETEGVNTKVQLAKLERAYQARIVEDLMSAGLSCADPARLDIRGKVTVGRDCFVDVNVVFEGDVVLGDNVVIEPNSLIRSSTIGSGTRICAMSHLEDAVVGENATIGPFARLRPGTRLANKTKIGNFVETKKAVLGEGSKVNHLSYIGDAQLGANVNVGAGTITCNYDGANKFVTTMGDNVFIGSNSTLVAPVEIETDGFVGAGSVVTKTVNQGELAIGRAKQRNISGWKRPVKEAK
jgi:bifunctional UDP-N-acetylglucosamine pyrophosphorylase/glucosamine-1-phosphate N-acetyltransferase